MRAKRLLYLFCCLPLAFAACEKKTAAPASKNSQTKSTGLGPESEKATFDACELIKKEEIEAVQGSPIKNTKSSGRSNAGFETAQCFYMAAEFSRSVSFSVTRSDPRSPTKKSLKEFWKETFGRYQGEKKEQEGDKEKKESLQEQRREKGEEEGAPLKKIAGIGDDAYWSGSRVGGALYVLKNETFIRVSVGGADNEETKIAKSTKLAQKALDRL
jgi:hypothetical protein